MSPAPCRCGHTQWAHEHLRPGSNCGKCHCRRYVALDRTRPCRSCSADLLWITTQQGKAMPLDSDSSPDGNVSVYTDNEGRLVGAVLAGKQLAAARRSGRDLYVSHFQRCPSAQRWRRRATTRERVDLMGGDAA